MSLTFDRKHGKYIFEDKAAGYYREVDRADAAIVMREIARWLAAYHVCEEAEFRQEWLARKDIESNIGPPA